MNAFLHHERTMLVVVASYFLLELTGSVGERLGMHGNMPGHLQPLGRHQAPDGNVQEIHGLLEPSRFFEEFVRKSKAVLFKGLCRDFKAREQWNDVFLRENYGELEVSVDTAKKENRYLSAMQMKMKDFLNDYKKNDWYMIDTLPKEMWGDLEIPNMISCGGFLETLQDILIWFSSGNSKSHLHMDTVDNINCMISGSKQWFLVDLANSERILMDHEEGDYCSVNVDKVNMIKYPFLKDLAWWNATVEEGDCIYVPYGWAHQVSSSHRNIAINIWWTPMSTFNESDCRDTSRKRRILDLKFNYANQYSYYKHVLKADFRCIFLSVSDTAYTKLKENVFSPSKQEDMSQRNNFRDMFQSEHTGRRLISQEDFDMVDKNRDGEIDHSEIQKLTGKELNEIFDGEEPGTVNIKGKSQKIDVKKEEKIIKSEL